MIKRLLVAVLLLGLMAGTGLGVYHLFDSRKTPVHVTAVAPTQARPRFALPGTLVVAQHGDLYALRNGQFTPLTSDHRGWMQPTVLPDGRMVAVSRQGNASALYLLDQHGAVLRQLSARDRSGDIGNNHWYFFPRLSADGTTLLYSHDEPKVVGNFRVDLAVWSSPLAPAIGRDRQVTEPNQYTGGDVEPVPLAGGGLIYVKYGIDSAEKLQATVMLRTPRGRETELTRADEDCSQPALSPDGLTLAMICTHDQQVAGLVTAAFDGTTLAPRRTVVDGTLCAVPVWAPDGRSLAYLAPGSTGGGFQLWWLDRAGTPSPPAPRQLTDDQLDFDATSSLAWTAS